MYPWILLESSPITHRRSPNCLCRKAEAQSQVSGINVVTPNHVDVASNKVSNALCKGLCLESNKCSLYLCDISTRNKLKLARQIELEDQLRHQKNTIKQIRSEIDKTEYKNTWSVFIRQ